MATEIQKQLDDRPTTKRPKMTLLLQVILPVIVFGCVAAFSASLYQQQLEIERNEARKYCYQQVRQVVSGIENSVSQRFSRADALMHVVSLNPQMSDGDFESFASHLLSADPGLRSMGLIVGTTIRCVYPREGNEDAIGKDLLQAKDQASAVLLVKQERLPVLSGPLNLLQGGRAFVHRVPILVPGGSLSADPKVRQRQAYWGHVALVVDVDLLTTELKRTVPVDLKVSLTAHLSDSNNILLLGQRFEEEAAPIEREVALPGANWTLEASPQRGWPTRLKNHQARLLQGVITSGLIAFLSSLLLHLHLQRSRNLKELRWANHSLEVTQKKLQLALTRGNIGLWDCDVDVRTMNFSDSCRTMLRDTDQASWTNTLEDWQSRLHPDEKSETKAAFKSFVESHQTHLQSEFRMLCGDGTYRWFRTEATTSVERISGRQKVSGVLIDVTADRRYREELQDARIETQMILDSIPSMVVLHDSTGHILRVNESVVRTTGLTPDELASRNIASLLPASGDLKNRFDSQLGTAQEDGIQETCLHHGRWIQVQRIALRNSRGLTDQIVTVSSDMTALKRAEQLEETSNRFQEKVGELARIGGWELDLINNKLTWSDMVKEIHEVPMDYQPDIETAINFYREDVREQIQKAIDRAIKDNSRWEVKLPLITARGRQIHVRAMGQPEFENGECVTIWGVFQDVTQIHQESELREALFRHAPNAYLLFDDSGIIECNPRTLELLRASGREDVLGRQPSEFSPKEQPCGSLSSVKCVEVDLIARQKGVCQFEWLHRRLDGELFPCEVTLSTLELDSRLVFLEAWKDLSEVKTAERERDQFFALSLDLFCIIDKNGCFKRVNSAWHQAMGHTSLIGVPVSEIACDQDKAATDQMLLSLTRTGTVTAFRHQVKWHDGSSRTLEWNALAFSLNDSVFFAVARDITERILAEEQLSSLNSELQQTNQALRQSNVDLQQFAYVASHDLQTPLRGILGFAQLLDDHSRHQLDETGCDFLGNIISGTARMQQMISDLLMYSRIEIQGRQLKSVDLNQVIDDCFVLMQDNISKQNATVTRSSLPTVWGDAGQLSQLFCNLIENGIKYNDSHSPEVTIVSAESVSQEIDRVFGFEVVVCDNGIGIDDEFRNQVFEMFRRLHTEGEYSGTGIGLAICRRVMQRHGGTISVSGHGESGSCFRLKFPAMTEE